MTDVIAHRGPDGEGHWLNESATVGFGHRRLSIIDLSDKAKQPMHYADGRYTITYNGEIYNYIELREHLKDKGYKFNSNSDTEVLLALYDHKKEKCLDDLDGMFAFAIWDERKKSLFCARDRFGEKPFYYYCDKEQFVFASEIKQFWAAGIRKETDQEMLLRYVNSGQIEDPDNVTATFYKNILQLDAAHYLLINENKELSIKRYWGLDTNAASFIGSTEEAASRFLTLFTESICKRLRSDVPVGSSLSGGLDSSSIVMIIDRMKGKETKQNTFSARFRDFSKDEGSHIQSVVQACQDLQVHETWPDKEYFENVFDKVVFHQDEPFGSSSIVAQYAVMELAKKNNVTVLLDGQGADEQLAGYLYYYHRYLIQLLYRGSDRYKDEYNAYLKNHQAAYPFQQPSVKSILRMRMARALRTLFGKEHIQNTYLRSSLKHSSTVCGLKELLRYADRNSMAHSVEVRLPFLDHKLAEFIFSLPDDHKINSGWTKFVLRKAMTGILPESICWRVDKVGYEPPENIWIHSKKFEDAIEKTARFLSIQRIGEPINRNVFTQNWRLLMTSRYI